MYKLKSTIKCPKEMEASFVKQLKAIGIEEMEIETVPYGKFINESRLYWDFVFPEMLSDEKDVTYISYVFDDTPEGRNRCHDAELKIGWIPQNIRYITV